MSEQIKSTEEVQFIIKQGLIQNRVAQMFEVLENDYGIPSGIAQSLAVLNDVELGPLVVRANKAYINATRKHGIFTFNWARSSTDPMSEELFLEREKRYVIQSYFSKKILQGQLIVQDDFNFEKIFGQVKSVNKTSDEHLVSDVWHFVCQPFIRDMGLTGFDSMFPRNIFSLSLIEAEKKLEDFYDEKAKELKMRLDQRISRSNEYLHTS